MLISQMEDSHLLNTIRLYSVRAREALNTLEGSVTQAFSGALRHSLNFDEEEAKEQTKTQLDHRLNTLGFYVFEAARRGLSVQKQLELATGMTGVQPKVGRLLSPSFESDMEEEDIETNWDHGYEHFR